jgi:hypothetical protein
VSRRGQDPDGGRRALNAGDAGEPRGLRFDDTILTFNRQFRDMWHVPESVLRGPTAELMRHAKEQLSNPGVLRACVARFQTFPATDASAGANRSTSRDPRSAVAAAALAAR